MKFDLHCHTKEGSLDSKVSVQEYVYKFMTLGYDGFMISDHNSYKGPLDTNKLDWTRAHRPEFAALTAFYRGMLAIRRAYPRLSGAAGEPEPFILMLPGWLIGFVPENDGTATAGQLAVYYNPERTRQWASLPAGTWRKVSDGVHAGVTPFGPCFRDALELAPTSVTVLVAE